MRTEKKIFLGEKDGLDFAVRLLQETPAELLILNIPRDSVLGKSIDNFHTLKGKASLLNKEIFIESLDSKILEMASAAGLKSLNPLFRRGEKIVSDIVPKSKPVPKTESRPVATKAEAKPAPEAKPKFEKRPPELPKIFFEPKAPALKKVSFTEPRVIIKKPKSLRWRLAPIFVVIMILAGGVLLANGVLPKADIAIVLKKNPVAFNENVEVSVAAKSVQFSPNIVLPGELITVRRNLTLRFPASGKEKVERKAKGTLIVYNAYSSEPQVLVQNTRFVSPAGKVFRLNAKTVVPGAKIVNNKIEPSKIEVAVTADGAGEEYNVPPAAGWRIPGFQGTPRYDGFYAESVRAMDGGMVGEVPKATEEDIKSARSEVLASLQKSLESEAKILMTSRFKLFDEGRAFQVLAEKAEAAGSDGSFGYFMEAEARYLVFEEEMLKNALRDKVVAALDNKEVNVREFKVEYGKPSADFAAGRLAFSASGELTLVADIKTSELKAKILGASEEKLKQAVFFLPGLEKANVSLWPFWVSRVPKNPDRVGISVN